MASPDLLFPSVLYPSAFLTPWDASAVVNDLENIVYKEFADLQAAAKNLYTNPNTFTDFQKVIFNADYDTRLQRSGYPGFNRDAGVDLYNQLSAQQSYEIVPITDEFNRPLAHYVIQPLNIKESSIDLRGKNSPIVYISSPYSVAKAISNIANKGDRRSPNDYSGGYMMSYWDGAGYRTTISGQIPGRDSKLTTETYYPLSSANDSNSISLKTGANNDFVLFDNSHSEIHLNDGDDTVAPSAAAFLPSIQFGQNIINSIKEDSTQIKSGKTITSQSEDSKFSSAGTPISSGNNDYTKNTSTPQKNLSRLLNGYANQGTGDFSGFGYVNQTWYATKTDITDAEQEQSVINIGGQRIYGGPGNDFLYGFDQSQYGQMSALETASSNNANGPLNLKFLNNDKTDINWTPILLSGGEGLDNFFIGDLSKINLRGGKIDSSHPNGSTLYTLLGDKNTLADVYDAARSQESWGEGLSADTYNMIASYDYTTEVIQKAINIDYSTNGVDIDPFGAAQVGRKSAKATLDVAKAFGKSFPMIEAAVSVINLGIEIGKTFSKPKPATLNKFYREKLEQKVVPPGSWNQVINIPDWDPLDRFVIQTIPINDPNVKQAEAWKNVNFTISLQNNSSMTPQTYGYTLEMETSVGGKRPVAFLTGLQSPNNGAEYGYQTYNFFTGQQKKIDPLVDIAYFGVLANTDGAEKIRTSYVEDKYTGGIQINKDASLFLWDSPALRRAKLLDQYRSAASSIQVGVDTRKFGWYTDLKYNGSDIDLSTSTFNHWDRNQNKWVAISLEKLKSIKPDTLAAQNAAKARFSYWTAQDTYANKLMNLSAADAANSNDVEFYKTRDDGSVLDPITGKWLAPSHAGYEQAALSEANYAGALSIQQKEDGTTKLIVDDGYKLAPFIETTFADGRVDHIFAFDDVHANDPEHTRDSMVQIDATGMIRFEDVIGGDYDYNDAVLDPTLYPELAALLASSLFN
jgi:hypothetical protein